MKKIKFFLLSFFVFILFFTLTSFVFGSSPTVTVTANPTSLQNSGTSTITWSSTNATECNTNGHGTATSGSFLTPVISTNTNYHVSCDKDACVEGWPPLNFGCANKTTQQACAAVINTRALPPEPACDWTNVYAQNSANVTIVPTVTVTATPSVVSSGGSSSISWTSPSTATSCTMTGGGLSVSGKSNSGISTGSLSSTTTYTVSCILNQVNSDCLSGFPGATMWPSNNPNNQGNSYGTGEQFCHSRDTSQATCDAAQASPGGEDPVQNVCEWSPGSPGTTLSGSATVTVADNNVSCQSMVATSTTNGSSNISWTSTNANTCNSGGHGTGISGFFTVTPTTTTTYPISCTRNAQTISGPCSGTYSVQSGSCGGEEVSGSVCGGSVPGGDEGDPCSSFNSQGSCVITGDPWCHHGCHWNFSNTTASCSDFTIQSSCTAHSGCNWGAGYTVPSATTTCPATVNVVRVNAFTQNNTPSLYLPYQEYTI